MTEKRSKTRKLYTQHGRNFTSELLCKTLSSHDNLIRQSLNVAVVLCYFLAVWISRSPRFLAFTLNNYIDKTQPKLWSKSY